MYLMNCFCLCFCNGEIDHISRMRERPRDEDKEQVGIMRSITHKKSRSLGMKVLLGRKERGHKENF